jgi:hypothetical protein
MTRLVSSGAARRLDPSKLLPRFLKLCVSFVMYDAKIVSGA